MVQAVESDKKDTGTLKNVPDSPAEPVKASHLHLVDETNDPNVRVGHRLKTARIDKGLTLEDVARQIKFRKEYLDAIERMQVAQLPKGFVNPYIRDYSRFLGLDPVRCVEDFNLQCGALSQADAKPVPSRAPPADNTGVVRLCVTLLIVALTGAGLWFGYNLMAGKSGAAPKPASGPSIAVTPDVNGAGKSVMQTATQAAVLTQTVNLEIRANERAWIEIRGADGTVFVDRRFSKGEVYDLRVGAGWTLTTPDAGAFQWIVDGKEGAPLGEPTQAIYTLSVDIIAASLTRQEG